MDPFSPLLPAIMATQDFDPPVTDMKNQIAGQDRSKDTRIGMPWKVSAGALTCAGRISMPEALRDYVIRLFPDHPDSDHFGALRTA